MSPSAAAKSVAPAPGIGHYQRHRPEQTLLYRIVEQHYPAFIAHLAAQCTVLSVYVRREFEDYLKCGRLEEGFLRVRCDTCQAGRKVFILQTVPACEAHSLSDGAGKAAGFSLHAGVAAGSQERKKLERLCRYISRPPVSEKRLSLTPNGNIRYRLKSPYKDGTTHVIFEPLDFIARLAALVPKPRVNLTRFHGVFAPNSRHRVWVTPAKRGKGKKAKVAEDPPTPAERHASMRWAQRLKRVFHIDIKITPPGGRNRSDFAVVSRLLRGASPALAPESPVG